MTTSDPLYLLIQSLTKAEKRYVKLFMQMNAGRQGKVYQALFDTLMKLPAFDLDQLKRKWPLTDFPKHLQPLKTKLFSFILKSLRTLHAGRTIESELRRLLEEIEYLYHKGLVPECQKRIKKAMSLATQYEKEEIRLLLIKWDRKVFFSSSQRGQSAYFQRLLDQESACIQQMSQQTTLGLLNERIRTLSRAQPRVNTRKEHKPFLEVMNHPLLQADPPQGAFLAKVYYLNIHGVYQIAAGNFQKAFPLLEQNMQMWRNSPWFIAEEPDLYLGIFNNYLSCCLHGIHYYPQFEAAVKEIRALTDLPPEIQLKFQRVAYFQEFAYAMNFGGLDAGVAFIPEMEKWLHQNKKRLPLYIVLVFYYNVTMFFFAHEEYPSAHRWLLKIIHEPGKKERQDIRDFARVFQLVLHFELGNLDVQEYLLRSAYRYFLKTKTGSDFEALLIGKFQELGQQEKPVKTIYQEFKEALTELKARKGERIPLGLAELILWTEGKITGIGIKGIWEKQILENRSEAGL